jgi:site-specific recombinase XerD
MNAGFLRKVTMALREERNTPFSDNQLMVVRGVLQQTLDDFHMQILPLENENRLEKNDTLLASFLAAKTLEGCSKKTIHYYETTIKEMLVMVGKPIAEISTDELRTYLTNFQETHHVGKVTMDNVRRILSTFFSWMEDEDHVMKSPIRKIHKVKIMQTIKETLTDEEIEKIRENCTEKRDLALIDFLLSTGMRVGELVLLNRNDINFQERECKVLGKGNKEREVYFDAKAKMHLEEYLASRTDSNEALFVAIREPYERMTISGIEVRVKEIGWKAIHKRVHPHKFRRTLATMAIDKGMPIEQVQNLLGHVKIDTTMHYAMVNQENVKISHRKFIS